MGKRIEKIGSFYEKPEIAYLYFRMPKKLHIVSFNVPYPPDYGGIIDVFYKIKALAGLNIDIYLHAYDYGKGVQDELNKYCKQVFYYKRSYIKGIFSSIPFTVASRSDDELLRNLEKIQAPILFEGLHCTYPLLKSGFKNRKILVRTHNIEHAYFNGLANSEHSIFKRVFFKLESKKFLPYEKILNKADYILTISPSEQDHFQKHFQNKAVYIPAFHQNTSVKKLAEKGNYALYHGDLRVSDNIKAVHFLIAVFKGLPFELIIASSYRNNNILSDIDKQKNVAFKKIKNQSHLMTLLENAHINVLPTFQNTGIKLKLINALYNGRFCLVNNAMVTGTGLQNVCEIANNKEEFKQKLNKLFNQEFTEANYHKRVEVLQPFEVTKNASKIAELI